MKEKGRKKLIAGLASTLMFFGKNVYATSSTASTSSSGKIGFELTLLVIGAISTVGLYLLPILFWTTTTGLLPLCSLPIIGSSEA